MIKNFTTLAALFFASFGGQTSAEQFQTEDQFTENLSRQTRITPLTLEKLYQYGVTDETELRLEYFFYTNREKKAASLHEALEKLGYSGRYGQSADEASIFIVTGWSMPVKMSKDSAVSWTETMCRIGFKYDAEFDGWGTNPEQ
ncbi:MAG: hypothetical protein GJ677_18750 [Rhodobacteraceae bacterium]|nr:hypothetical protein [Paracoccaceae bacterium]